MDQGKNSKIKKLIEELHAKKNPGQSTGGHDSGQTPKARAIKGAKQSGRYRPKV